MRYLTSVLVLMLLTSCAAPGTGPATENPSPGPPTIDHDVVRRHAEQFDVDVRDRPPGSQQELAAGSYILGHLQLAGYAPHLDRVPVADNVSSTNVVALPPSGAEPTILVTIAYDTGARHEDRGRYLGLFLELARVLNVTTPEHTVGFVAVGAESAERRGTRRLAQFLLDRELDPVVYSISVVIPDEEDAVKAAGFEHRFVGGEIRDVAETLLPLLEETRS
jgi:hypothetical protein